MLFTSELSGGNGRSEGASRSQMEVQTLGTCQVTRAKEEGQACPVLAWAAGSCPHGV